MKMDQGLYKAEHFLENFPPILRKHFKELLTCGKISLCPITINDITSLKQYHSNNYPYSYSHTLKIPYAGKRLTWELIFDPEDIRFPPDLNFNDNYFTTFEDFDTLAKSVSSLVNWNVQDPKCLTLMLKEFIELLKNRQLEKLRHENIYSQLKAEYEALIKFIPASNVELLLDYSTAHFQINLKVNLTGLPKYLQSGDLMSIDEMVNPGENSCILKISYLKLDGSRINSSLQLSPHVDQVLEGAKMHVPNVAKNSSIVEYVRQVDKMLKDHIKKVKQHCKAKRHFITTLSTVCSEKVLEFDSETFSSARLLLEVDNFYYIVHIEIEPTFPDEKPTITLQSLYCLATKKLCHKQFDSYPYSARWQSHHMISQLIEHLEGELRIFKNHKH